MFGGGRKAGFEGSLSHAVEIGDGGLQIQYEPLYIVNINEAPWLPLAMAVADMLACSAYSTYG